jgi:hypothetical protein
MAHDVFISYADNDKDRKIARAVCSTLESRGIDCWMAPRDILPGKHYAEAIVEAINAAQVMVLVLSSSANNSPQVLREVERAASKDIPIVTFRTEDVALKKALEYFLSSYHWLEATNLPLEASSKQLADTIERLLLPPEEQFSAEKKRYAAEKKEHPIWFWLGLLFFVADLGVIIYFLMMQVGSSGEANVHISDAFAWNLPFIFIGVILVWLSMRDVRKRWLWPGGVMFSYGLTAIPAWIYIMHNYWQHPPSPGEFALTIGLFSFPFIVTGAFCLWKGWPRTGSKRPRREWLSLTIVFCALCLVFSIIMASASSNVNNRDILSFSDNFQDGNANGWNLDPGWQVVKDNGNYVLSCQSQDFRRASPRVTSASDYALSADFSLLKGLFEFQVRKSSSSSYNVWINDNQVALGKANGQNIISLGTAAVDIGTTQWHKVEISLSGGNIKIYIDNSLKIDYQDENPLPSGSFLIQNHPDSGVELDNIVVKPPSTPTPTPSPTPTATPAPTITSISKIDLLSFSDNFQDGNADGWDLAPGWQVANEQGNYFLSCQGQGSYFVSPRVTSASDYVLQADLMVISGNVNFLLRYNGTDYYGVGISGNNVFIGKVVNSTFMGSLAGAAINIADNKWHTVKIAVSGSNILVAIDGENRIDCWDSDPLPAGWFGIQNSENSSVRVDNIVVGPNTASIPTPTPQGAGTVIFSDDFQDGVADGWNFDAGWRVVREGSNYMLSCQSQGLWKASPPVPSLSDYVVQMDFLLVSGTFDVHVRHSSLGDYPVWPMSNTVQLDKGVTNGNYLNLTWADLDIGFNSWHTVKIALEGGSIKISIDGSLVIDYSDAAYFPNGSFFIDCHTSSEVRVDNIVVTEI